MTKTWTKATRYGILLAVILAETACIRTVRPARPGETSSTVAGPGFFYRRTVVDNNPDSDPTSPELLAALGVATLIAKKLQEVTDTCSAIGRAEYQIDCLGEGYARAASSIPDDETFADARAAVARAAGQLTAIANANADAAAPQIAVPKASRKVRAVSAPKISAARAQATKVIEETETILLRSSDGLPTKEASYQKIVAAVDSAKFLLRSA